MPTWVGYPRSYTPGRNRPVQYVVIHDTEGSEGVTSAEDGAAYDKRRTDGTSTHLFVDADTCVQEVPFTDRAHGARFHGNEIGIQVELCGRAGQSAAQWHDAASLPMLRIAAREVAAVCRLYDLPPRRLSVAEVRAAYYAPVGQRPKGICGHVDVTKAYPEDAGTHTDPGPNFPWDEFLAMVAQELGDDMGFTQQQADDIAFTLLNADGKPLHVRLQEIENALADLKASMTAPAAVDLAALAEVLQGPAFLAALAKAVNDDAAARLQQ